MITLKSCPVCNSSSIATKSHQVIGNPEVTHELVPGVNVNAFLVTRYSTCQNCNLIFQNPRLSDTQLDTYYKTGYYRQTLNLSAQELDTDEANRAKKDAEIIKQQIDNFNSHLDIGCSRGFLLEAVGASVKVGVEPNNDYVTTKGIVVYSEINQVPKQPFDLVTAIHVLEHVPSPLDYLKTMTKFVKKNGYLIIEVPTWKSPGGPLRFAHLSHFEPDVLRLMCKEIGLTVHNSLFTPHLMLICQVNNE